MPSSPIPGDAIPRMGVVMRLIVCGRYAAPDPAPTLLSGPANRSPAIEVAELDIDDRGGLPTIAPAVNAAAE